MHIFVYQISCAKYRSRHKDVCVNGIGSFAYGQLSKYVTSEPSLSVLESIRSLCVTLLPGYVRLCVRACCLWFTSILQNACV